MIWSLKNETMKKLLIALLILLLAACSKSVPYSDETIKNDLRVPAYPLLMLHPHLRLWSTTDQLTEKNMIFTNGKNLPFVGFLRVDGTMYRFMCRRELPMQAIAPMAYDYESWEGKFTSLRPDEGWEQPDFNDQYWQVYGCGGKSWILIHICLRTRKFICVIRMMTYFNYILTEN